MLFYLIKLFSFIMHMHLCTWDTVWASHSDIHTVTEMDTHTCTVIHTLGSGLQGWHVADVAMMTGETDKAAETQNRPEGETVTVCFYSYTGMHLFSNIRNISTVRPFAPIHPSQHTVPPHCLFFQQTRAFSWALHSLLY